MTKVDNIYNDGKAFACCHYKRRDMLLKQFDHLVNYELANRIKNRKKSNIRQDLVVSSHEVINVKTLKRNSRIDNSN
jgi:hypothetical protein